MFTSIILGIILTVAWYFVITPTVLMMFMPFAMAGGEPGITKIKRILICSIPLIIAGIIYIVVPVLIFVIL